MLHAFQAICQHDTNGAQDLGALRAWGLVRKAKGLGGRGKKLAGEDQEAGAPAEWLGGPLVGLGLQAFSTRRNGQMAWGARLTGVAHGLRRAARQGKSLAREADLLGQPGSEPCARGVGALPLNCQVASVDTWTAGAERASEWTCRAGPEPLPPCPMTLSRAWPYSAVDLRHVAPRGFALLSHGLTPLRCLKTHEVRILADRHASELATYEQPRSGPIDRCFRHHVLGQICIQGEREAWYTIANH